MQTQKDVRDTYKKALWDIDRVDINKFDKIKNKTQKFAEDTGDNMESHINMGYVVRNHFSDEGYSATDAFIHYIEKIADV